ncbi:MAG: chemotaxis protein CheD [Leptospirales bacterium]|nr:chemotaxis protein CheD [Leptospirales bacterium]
MGTSNFINVGIADIKVSSGETVLRTILGSCIAICLYDRNKKIGGMAHIMLPMANIPNAVPEKYADTALPLLVDMMKDAGSDIKRVRAKITGGAQMFDFPDDKLLTSIKKNTIGKNNAIKVEQLLEEMGIELSAKDVGGNYARTINFDLSNGEVISKSPGIPDVIL